MCKYTWAEHGQLRMWLRRQPINHLYVFRACSPTPELQTPSVSRVTSSLIALFGECCGKKCQNGEVSHALGLFLSKWALRSYEVLLRSAGRGSNLSYECAPKSVFVEHLDTVEGLRWPWKVLEVNHVCFQESVIKSKIFFQQKRRKLLLACGCMRKRWDWQDLPSPAFHCFS